MQQSLDGVLALCFFLVVVVMYMVVAMVARLVFEKKQGFSKRCFFVLVTNRHPLVLRDMVLRFLCCGLL